QELQNEIDIGLFLSGLALMAVEGQPQLAARLFGAVEVRLDVNVDMNPAERAEYRRAVEKVRPQLGAKAFVSARRAGRTMTLEQILAASYFPAIVNPPPFHLYHDVFYER